MSFSWLSPQFKHPNFWMGQIGPWDMSVTRQCSGLLCLLDVCGVVGVGFFWDLVYYFGVLVIRQVCVMVWCI